MSTEFWPTNNWRYQQVQIENGVGTRAYSEPLAGWMEREGRVIPVFWDAVRDPAHPALRSAISDTEYFYWILAPEQPDLSVEELTHELDLFVSATRTPF